MKTKHRAAARAKWQDLPKFWQPKQPPQVVLDAKIVHWDLVDRFTTGTATQADLWDWMETGFTYTRMMHLLQADGVEFTDEAVAALNEQIACYQAVAQRYRETGKVGFNAEQLRIARAAAHVMDGLIEMDRHAIAAKAVLWSDEQMRVIRKKVAAGATA